MSAEASILTAEEKQRYARHIALADIGEAGQQKLKHAKVLVIGCGGLGSPLLQYLTAAGVGTIGIVDDDCVSLSNLQRQILFTEDDIGKRKVEVVQQKLNLLNPNVQLKIYPERLTIKNALQFVAEYDIICDGTDNFPTRYLVNDACVLTGKINVFAAVNKFEGQVAVFNYRSSINYRDIFPQPPKPGQVQNCAEAGVLGSMCGLVATHQANEVLKLILGIGEVLDGKLLTINTLQLTHTVFTIQKNPEIVIDKLIDYDHFCGVHTGQYETVTAEELRQKINQQAAFQLIDVREPNEHQRENIGGILLPLQQLENQLSVLDKTKPVIVYCQSGVRSAAAVKLLLENGFSHVSHLYGGIEAYSKST